MGIALGLCACDLEVTDIWFNHPGPYYAGQTRMTVFATIKNLGSNTCGTGSNPYCLHYAPFYIGLWLNGQWIGSFYQYYVPMAGESRTYAFYPFVPAYSGTLLVTAEADVDNDLAEAREWNNTLTKSFWIQPANLLPDLVVRNLRINDSSSPGTYRVGETITISCDVKNIGDGSAARSSVGFYISDSASDTRDVNRVQGESAGVLSPSTSTFEYDNITLKPKHIGRMYVTAMADDYEDVGETNERNNVIFIGPFNVVSDPPVVDLGPDRTINCSESCISLSGSVTGGSDNTFYWAPGGETSSEIEVCSPGKYTLTVTDRYGGVSSDSVTVVADIEPPVFDAGEDRMLGAVGSVLLDATVLSGTEPYTFRWIPGGEETEDIWVDSPGTYILVVTNANGCTAEASVDVARLENIAFADSALDEAFRSQYDLNAGDSIYADDLRFTSLMASGRGIRDLSGLEKLVNLRTIDLSYNQIRDITALGKLEQLTSLDLEGNLVSDIATLVSNLGLSSNDTLNLLHNFLDVESSVSAHLIEIQLLESRGVDVSYLPQDESTSDRCHANLPSADGERIIMTEAEPIEIIGTLQVYVTHGFCSSDPFTPPCDDLGFALYVDETQVFSEHVVTPLVRNDVVEGYRCDWLSVFPENSLEAGTHTFRGVWSCADCNFGPDGTAEQSKIVEVIYPDAGKPSVLDVSVSDLLITDSDANLEFTVTVKYSESMTTDGSADPVLEFSPEIESTLTATSTNWLDSDTFVLTYTVIDSAVDVNGVTIDIYEAQDSEGNPQLDYTPEHEFEIDMEIPTLDHASTNLDHYPVQSPLLQLTDSDIGEPSAILFIWFSEKMDLGVRPKVTFDPVISESVEIYYESWTADGSFYFVLFDTFDTNLTLNSIDIIISGARDENGNEMALAIMPSVFNIDTRNPSVTGVTIWVTNSNEPEQEALVTISYSEPMKIDGAANPTLVVSAGELQLFSLLDLSWISDTQCEFLLAIPDTGFAEALDGAEIIGAQDVAGNEQISSRIDVSTASISISGGSSAEPPSITCPADTSVFCGGSISPSITGNAQAWDQEGNALPVTYEDEPEEACPGAFYRTWRTADSNGGVATCAQTICYEGIEITCPPGVILCGAPISPTTSGFPSTQGGFGDVELSYVDEAMEGSPGAYYRMWEAIDSQGNSCGCIQILETDSSVVRIECPPEVTFERGGSMSPDVTGYAVLIGSVCENTTLEYVDREQEGNPGAYVRIWFATDAFGDSTGWCSQGLEPEEIWITCPPDATVICGSSVSPSITGYASLPSSVAGSLFLDYEDEYEEACPGAFYRTWFAIGSPCNVSPCRQIIQYEEE